jgi:2-polyprenyl-3-methyl-5-hydroxy-6-metoxy-1,4-benzoquinol methylase
MAKYKDYGWENNEFTNAHSYLLSSITQMLPKDGSPILDIGCGNGAIANYLIKNGYNVYGTDASYTGISKANELNPNRFFIQDLSSDNLPDELTGIKFKTILSTEVIEHLYDPRKYIEFCKSILMRSGGGTLILSTPYHGYLKNLVMAVTGTLDKHFTVLWDGGHIKFWSYQTLTMLLNEFDIEINQFKGVGRLPYLWKSMIIQAKVK